MAERSKFAYKVPGGKLLKILLEHDSGRIKSVKITGDFFAHPEDCIEELEEELAGVRLDEVEGRVKGFFSSKKRNIELFGVNAEAISYAILSAAGVTGCVKN